MRHCAGDSYVYRYLARRSEISIEAFHEFQVDAALCAKVELAFAAQLHRSCCQQIGAFAREAEFLNPEKLPGYVKTHWPIVAQFDVFHVRVKLSQISHDVQFARPSKRSVQLQVTADGRMAGDPPLQVGSQQRVNVELIEMQVYGRWPVTTQMNIAVDGQFCLPELRLPGKAQICSLCHCIHREVAGALVIEGEVVQLDSCCNSGCISCSRTDSGEVHATFHCHAAVLQLRNSRKIKIRSREIKVESTGGEVELDISCDS